MTRSTNERGDQSRIATLTLLRAAPIEYNKAAAGFEFSLTRMRRQIDHNPRPF